MKDPKTAVKTALAERGMTMTQLAEELGVPQQSVSRTINGPMVNQKSLWPRILTTLNLTAGVEPEKPPQD